MSGTRCLARLLFGVLVIFCFYGSVSAAPEGKVAGAELGQGDALTEQLWSLVRSLGQLRADYYEKQGQRSEEIGQLRETAGKLEAEVEELRRREEAMDKDLAGIQAEIAELGIENAENQAMQLSVAGKLDEFVAGQGEEVERGIPYRKNDRLARLAGRIGGEQPAQGRSVADVFGGIWSFSQEEMRIARSGETYTDLVELGERQMQYARLFRVGHQVLGYVTEQEGRVGIWSAKGEWESVGKREGEAVKEAVQILDQKSVPNYVQLPVRIEPADIKTRGSED